MESIHHGELGNNYLTRDSGTGVWSLSIMVNLETVRLENVPSPSRGSSGVPGLKRYCNLT